jgi:hypothetical protein
MPQRNLLLARYVALEAGLDHESQSLRRGVAVPRHSRIPDCYILLGDGAKRGEQKALLGFEPEADVPVSEARFPGYVGERGSRQSLAADDVDRGFDQLALPVLSANSVSQDRLTLG